MVESVEKLPGDDLVLRAGPGTSIEGSEFTRWESVRISRSVTQGAGTFSLDVTATDPWALGPGDRVVLEAGSKGELLLDGYIDSLDAQSSHDRYSLSVAGRDRTGELVDCSAVLEPSEWFNQRVDEIAASVAGEFGIKIRKEAPYTGDPFPRFQVEPGETAFDLIERACRLRSLLCYADGDGTLVLARPGDRFSNVDLIEGGGRPDPQTGALGDENAGNVKSSRVRHGRAKRFSVYIVQGQGAGTDEGFGEFSAHPEGRAEDPGVGTYRPLLVIAEGAVSAADCEERARWEAAVRAAQSTTLEVVVAGWHQEPGGELWRINTLVNVDVPKHRIRGLMLIDRVTYSRSATRGAEATMRLVRRSAYDAAPVVPPADEFEEFLNPDG